MSRQPLWLCAISVVAWVMIFLRPAPGAAQVFGLGDWEGALEGLTYFDRVDTKTKGSPQTTFDTLHSEERLSLKNVGAYLYDPGLVTFTLGGTFGLVQENVKSNTFDFSREGTLWGYEAFAGILSGKPTSLNLFANRNQFFLLRELAGETKVETETQGGMLLAQGLYIPSTLTVRQDLYKDETRIGDSVSARNETRTTLTYLGQRGWLDSEMEVRYQFVDLTNKVSPDLSYKTHEGSLDYSLNFGPYLERRWDSRLRAYSQTGIADQTYYAADESLTIDHTDQLQTQYRYSFFYTDTPGGADTTHAGTFTLLHRLYENLTTTFTLNGTYSTLPGGRTESASGFLDLAYTKRLPWNGYLSVSGGGGAEYQDRRFSTAQSFIPQETHTAATPFALPISLNNPFVITTSVVVTKVAVGPLPVGCIAPPGPPTPLVLGRDYTLLAAGDFTEIVPMPCAGGTPGINPSDTIAVDYQFSVSPSLAYLGLYRHGSLTLDYRWIRPYVIYERREQDLISGQDGSFLDTRESSTAGTELRYDGLRLRASVLGEATRFRSSREVYDTIRSRQFMGFSILPEMTLTLTADEALIEYKNPNHITRTLNGRGTLGYHLGGNLFADLLGGVRWFKDTLLPTERVIESSVKLRWIFRNLEVTPTAEFIDRRRGDTDTKEYRGILDVIRRF